MNPPESLYTADFRGEQVETQNGFACLRIEIPRGEIGAFCGRWGIAELSLFGSALREDFRPESDIDLLVRFFSGEEYGLLAFARMREELEAIFERPVDLVTEQAVDRSENRIKRRHIRDTRVVIHEAG